MREPDDVDEDYRLHETAGLVDEEMPEGAPGPSQEEMLDEMDLERGHLYKNPGDERMSDLRKVDAIQGGCVYFHFPFVDHPQDSRYSKDRGHFHGPVAEVYKGWKQGRIVPAELEMAQ